MVKYDSILIPVDGTDIYNKTIRELNNVVDKGVNFHVISVVDMSVLESDPLKADYRIVESRSDAKEFVREASKDLEDMGYDVVKEEVVEGWPLDCIIDYYKLNDIDLILMGTHGDDILDKSVTLKFVQELDAPVLTVGGKNEV